MTSSIRPPSDGDDDELPVTLSSDLHPRYATLRARVNKDDDLAILDQQYAKMSDAQRQIVDSILAATETALTGQEASYIARFVSRLLHLAGTRPEQRRNAFRVVAPHT